MGSTGAAQSACAAPSSAAARPSRGAAALQPCCAAVPLVPLSGVRYAPPEQLQTHMRQPRTEGYGGAPRGAREVSSGVHCLAAGAGATDAAVATPPSAHARRASIDRLYTPVTLHRRCRTPSRAPEWLCLRRERASRRLEPLSLSARACARPVYRLRIVANARCPWVGGSHVVARRRLRASTALVDYRAARRSESDHAGQWAFTSAAARWRRHA